MAAQKNGYNLVNFSTVKWTGDIFEPFLDGKNHKLVFQYLLPRQVNCIKMQFNFRKLIKREGTRFALFVTRYLLKIDITYSIANFNNLFTLTNYLITIEQIHNIGTLYLDRISIARTYTPRNVHLHVNM